MSWTLKIFALVIAAVFLVRYSAANTSLFDAQSSIKTSEPMDAPIWLNYITILVVWFEFASLVLVFLYPFFPKIKVLKNYVKTFALVSSFLNFVLLRWITCSFAGEYCDSSQTVGSVFLAIEVGLVFCMSLHTMCYNGGFRVRKKELLDMLYFLPVVFLSTTMPYLFRALFGNFGFTNVTGFKSYHRGYIYFTFALLVVMFIYFMRRKKEFIRVTLLFVSLGALISYCYCFDYTSFAHISQWPLNLTNLMLFAVVLCLMFRCQWLFDFTMFIGVACAVMSLLLPVYSSSLAVFSTETVTYWLNVIVVLDVPIVMAFYKLYHRPKLKGLLYSFLAFFVYYLGILLVCAIVSQDGEVLDYFFINSDRIANILGSVGSTLYNIDWTINVGNLVLEFHPVYQLLYFVFYILIGVLLWFFYPVLFRLQDVYASVFERRREIKVEEYAIIQKYGLNEFGECMNEETKDKLVVRNLYKRYGSSKNYSVDNASFEVHSGEILGFLGHNGAGKSSIIKCIVGIQPATSGEIEVNGYDVFKQSVEAKMQIGFVPDHYALYERLTGREYINYVADLYNVSKEDRDARLEDLLEKLSMKDAIDTPIQTYSHGMKQKTAIMSALIHNPKLWILDEPLTGLDPTSIYQVKECMKEHAAKGNIVFFSSHLIDVVEKLCNRIIIIKRGHIMTEANIDELTSKGVDLEQFYLDVSSTLIEGVDDDVDIAMM